MRDAPAGALGAFAGPMLKLLSRGGGDARRESLAVVVFDVGGVLYGVHEV